MEIRVECKREENQMKFRVFIWMAALLLVFVAAGLAADVTGKWVAQVPGRDGTPREQVFNLKQSGETLTGAISGGMGGGAGERQISDGKVSGNSISFTVVMEFGGNTMKMLYKGTVSGNEMKLSSTREGSDRPPREITAKKQ
jgi:hypothetical protein